MHSQVDIRYIKSPHTFSVSNRPRINTCLNEWAALWWQAVWRVKGNGQDVDMAAAVGAGANAGRAVRHTLRNSPTDSCVCVRAPCYHGEMKFCITQLVVIPQLLLKVVSCDKHPDCFNYAATTDQLTNARCYDVSSTCWRHSDVMTFIVSQRWNVLGCE